jgi:methyl-accepting chemotaxis protein
VAEISGSKDEARFGRMVRERLDALIKGTRGLVAEQEPLVLKLGDGLRQVWSDASELSQKAQGLADNLAGDFVTEAVQQLQDSLITLGDVCEGGEGVESLAYFEDILATASSLGTYLGEFQRIVRTLQILGISTRIESARLGSEGRGFSTLADDVEKLASNIVVHSAQIREKYQALEQVVHEATDKTREIITLQGACASQAKDSIKANLSSMEEFLNASSDRAVEFAATSTEISSRVGEAVSSMQFHDIVRQRVEHVDEAFVEMERELESRRVADMERLAAWMGRVARLQSRQLAESGESFHVAIEGLKENLRGIGGAISSMCGSMKMESGGADNVDDSPLQRVQQGIAEAMDGVQTYARQGEEIRSLMSDVAGIVKDMSAFVEDIEEVGAEIELIALNASVRAAHTGEKGAALGVLAIEIQGLSARARTHTGGVADVLTKVSRLSDVLVEHAEGSSNETEMGGAIEELGSIVDKLSRGNAEVQSESGHLVLESQKMVERIHKLTDRVVFHETMREKLVGFSRRAEELEAAIWNSFPEALEAELPEELRDKLDRYTMESERDTHRSIFGGGTEHDASSGQDGGDVELFSDDDMDDNIELF